MSVSHEIATLEHVEAIARIDTANFGNPWTEQTFAEEVQRPHAVVEVVLVDSEVVGFSCTWYVAAGEVEGHLLRIAVDPSYQRRGLGRDLLGAVLQRSAAREATRTLLEVAASNRAALGLYRALGFVEIGRRVGYYKAPPDDAVIMAHRM